MCKDDKMREKTENTIRCSKCGKLFPITIHALVDWENNPEAVNTIENLSFNRAVCPHCGYPLPDVPPSHQRYAVTAVGQYYANPYAEEHLMRFCGFKNRVYATIVKISTSAAMTVHVYKSGYDIII